jgi:hypothetical protein
MLGQGRRVVRSGLARLVAAEWVKASSTRSLWWLLAAALAYTAFTTAVSIAVTNSVTSFSTAFVLDTPRGIRAVLADANAGSILAVVVGILGVTSEYRHRTMAQTLLVTPDRRRVLLGKVATYALVGLAFGVLDCVVALAVAVPWLSSLHLLVPVLSGDAGLVLGGVVLATVLFCLMGLGLGALVKNQVAAVIIALAWLLLIQNVLQVLPGARDAITGGAAIALFREAPSSAHLLPAWAGALVLLGYAVVLIVAGGTALVYRDAG